MFIYNEYSKLCFALVLYLSSSLQLIQNKKIKKSLFFLTYMVMLHVQKYLARKVRFFKLYCNNYLFLDICMNLKEILKILFVSVSSYFLLAKSCTWRISTIFCFVREYLNIISMLKLSNFSK